MKINYLRFLLGGLLLVLVALLPSCKKFVEVNPPIDRLTTETVFSSDETANAAALGIFSDIMRLNNYVGNGGTTVYCGLSADELTTTSTRANYEPFLRNSLLPTNTTVSTFIWQKAYFHVYQANSLLENLEKSTNISEDLQRQLIGEAKFVRAFFHFYLFNLFGPVPLVTTTNYQVNAKIDRSDSNVVYSQIVKDLKDAKTLLTDAYFTGERVRPNKWAAAALLARVYLFQEEWSSAESEATDVINSGLYELTDLPAVFLPNSKEAILQLIPPISQIFNTAEAFDFIPASSANVPLLVLTQSLSASFDSGDLRRSQWIKTVNINGRDYSYPFKYKVRFGTSGASKAEYSMVLRLGEQYLIRAEARAQQGNLSDALADVNVIRQRAGLPYLSSATGELILQNIMNERQKELFAEWGHRWLDLKRTRITDVVLDSLKSPDWQTTDVLFPIPQSEIEKNPALHQNPGY